ncbi:MAG: phenylacetic acid degradation protein PaaN [Burkholderiaceae bacterium]
MLSKNKGGSVNFFAHHQELLTEACQAVASRHYWSAYPEMHNHAQYGEHSESEGKTAFDELLGRPFALDQWADEGWIGNEKSPYGFALGITYPRTGVHALIDRSTRAWNEWRKQGPEVWVGICLEILQRLNARSAEVAQAVMHTTGQPYLMAFQAGGPHAQERGLEAVAYAWHEMTRIPGTAVWEKPQGKRPPLKLHKHYSIVPRGIGLVIGCSTFPTWNSYSGIFASLATGNTIIAKPHPASILPLAITVGIAREVLAEAGINPDVVMLAVHEEGDSVAADLALRPEVRLIDFTGSRENGDWIERNAQQAQVYTEKAGVNQIIIDSTNDLQAMAANIAVSLTLYSGQMCTAPQNIYIPREGINVGEGRASFDEVASAIVGSVKALTVNASRAVELTGALQNDRTSARIDAARSLGYGVMLDSVVIEHPTYPAATVRSPLLLKVSIGQEDQAMKEFFGPISFLIETQSTERSIDIARQALTKHGAMTLSLYTRSRNILDKVQEAAELGGVALSVNMMGPALVNQSAAFSDFHGTGANPAANVALTDAAFVVNRFRVVQSRVHGGLDEGL